MISLDGAALLATMYPIVIILLVFELGRQKIPRPDLRVARVLIRAAHWLVAAGAVMGGSAITICVIAVASGEAVRGFDAGWVVASGWLLLLAGTGAVGVGLAGRLFDPWE